MWNLHKNLQLSDAENAYSSDKLMETKVLLKSPKKCKEMTGMKNYNPNSMICGYLKNFDACQVSLWLLKF